ncbi:Bile acid 7-alpha dehydratase [compost metagenome]
MMNDLQQLLAIEAIKRLKARYFHCMDFKDWDGLRDVFSAEAVFDVRGALEVAIPNSVYTDPPLHGIDNIVAYIRQGLTPLVSVHYGHMPHITLLTADTAEGIWSLEDWLYSAAGTFHGQGHYHERYVQTDQGWRIQQLRLTRLHVQSNL